MRTVKATRRSRLWSAALASAACLLGVGVVSAAEAMIVTHHITVVYRDLDLSTPVGAKQLYVRIERAAREACGFADQADLYQAQATRQCQSHAIADAVTDVHSPLVTALYNKSVPNKLKLTAMSQD